MLPSSILPCREWNVLLILLSGPQRRSRRQHHNGGLLSSLQVLLGELPFLALRGSTVLGESSAPSIGHVTEWGFWHINVWLYTCFFFSFSLSLIHTYTHTRAHNQTLATQSRGDLDRPTSSWAPSLGQHPLRITRHAIWAKVVCGRP